MRDLERELRELSSAIMVPPTPDLARAAHIRLRTTRPAASWPRRPVVLALVVAIVLVAGLAVSPARTAILRFFGIGAVQIELVDRLPAVQPSAPLALGSEIDPSKAPFPILRSDLLGDPDAVYASGEVVTLLYGSPDRVRLLVTEIGHSVLAPEIAKKIVAGTTNTRFVDIPGSTGPGIWIEGAPHVVVLADAPPREHARLGAGRAHAEDRGRCGARRRPQDRQEHALRGTDRELDVYQQRCRAREAHDDSKRTAVDDPRGRRSPRPNGCLREGRERGDNHRARAWRRDPAGRRG